MKKLLVLGAVALSVGCAGYQAKLDTAKGKAEDLYKKVECRAEVLKPYLDYVTGDDLVKCLEGADIADVLAVAGEADQKVKEVKAAFAACGKL